MVIFIDTSAFYALLCIEDKKHTAAAKVWQTLLTKEAILRSNNYVIVETTTLLQRRLGMEAVKDFQSLVSLLQVDWITEDQHQIIINTLLTSNRRHLSLVDCSSFATMRRMGIKKAFTFDKHFAEQGFEIV